MTKKKGISSENFLLQGSILAAASIIVRLIGLVYRIPLTGILGDEGNGIYAAAFSIYTILLLISSYSLPLAVSKLVSKAVAKSQFTNAYFYFKCALIFAVIVGAAVGVFSFVFSDFLAGTFLKTPLSAYSLRILSPTLFIVAVIGVFRGFFQGLGNMIPTAISQILEQIANAFVSVIAAASLFDLGLTIKTADGDLSTAYGAAGGVLGTCIGAFTAMVFLVIAFMKTRKYLKAQMCLEVNPVKDKASDTYKLLLMTIAPVILSTAVYNLSDLIDQSIFNNYMFGLGYDEEHYDALWGIFSGKYKLLTNVPIALASALASSIIPSLTTSMNKKEYVAVNAKINQAIRFTMLVTIPCFAGFTVLGGSILEFLWNDTNPVTISTLTYGSIAIVFFSLSTLTNGILQGIDKMKLPVIHAVISLIAHIGVYYLMLVGFENKVFAVVFSNIFFAFMMCILNLAALKKHSSYKQEYKKTYIVPLISSVIMGGVVYLVNRLLTALLGNSISCILSIVFGVAVYGICVIAFKGISKAEIAALPMGGRIVKVLSKLHLI